MAMNYSNPYLQGNTGWPIAANPYGQMGYQQPAAAVPMVQSYTATPMASNVIPVDGEVGAKAFQTPNGSTGPIALWDTNDNVIFLRTFNAAGMPNPLRKLRYTEEEMTPALPAGQSSSTGTQIDTSQFVTKDAFNSLQRDIQSLRSMLENNGRNQSGNNQNGSNSQQNGNRGR